MSETEQLVSLQAPGYWWRDDPDRYLPRSMQTTWHAVRDDLRSVDGLCGAATGDRLVARIWAAVACPDCVRLSGAAQEQER